MPQVHPSDFDAYTGQSFGRFTAQDWGFPGPQPSPPNGLPPGDGGWTTPNFLMFSALVQSQAKAFLYTTDEALRDSIQNAIAMRRDPVLMGSLRRRQRPTSQLSWHITPDDESNPAEAEAALMMEYIIGRIPRFQKMKMQLLEAIWFGKYAVEVAYEWRGYKGENKLFVRDFTPINGDKIRYRWDGTPGFLVSSLYPGKKEATDYGLAHFLTPDERLQYIIHEHEPDDADWIEPEMAGVLHGVGVRGRLYWFWWLKQQVFAQLMNYIHRFANGMTIFYYNAHDARAKEEATDAARKQFSNTALLYPRWPSENPDLNSVQRLEVGTASPALIWNLVSDYFDPIMERYIEGQTLSSNAEATGLGSGVAEAHGETLDEIIKYDAVDLQETLQTDLVNVLYSYNAPGVTPGKFEFEVDSPNASELLEGAQVLFEMGMSLDEDQLYDVAQMAKPKPGVGIVSKLGAMQPAAIGGIPQGVPVAGAAGDPSQPPTDPNDPNAMAMAQQGDPSQGMPPEQGYPMAYGRGKRPKPTNGKLTRRVDS